MSRGKKGKKFSGKRVIAVLILWAFWICGMEANAAQVFFPFAANDWILFENYTLQDGIYSELKIPCIRTCLKADLFSGKQGDDWSPAAAVMETLNEKDDKETKEAMAVPVKYDNILSDSDRQILYKVVSMECDTGYEGSLAVISCMLNRLESDKYPDDLMDVVTEKAQFSAYYDRKTDTYPYVDRVPSEECIAAVDDALAGKKRNLPSYILYFRSSEYKKLKGYKKYAQIGDNTYFYKEEDR